MSSYGFYLFVDAVKELLSVLAPVLVAIVLAAAALLAWRRYLAVTHRVDSDCAERIKALESRVSDLERRRRSGASETVEGREE